MTALAIAGFEVRSRLRRISTYVYFAVFLALGMFFVLAAGGAIPASIDFGTGGKLYINSPYALCTLITLIGHFGIVMTASIAGQATYQDIEHRASALFFTAPITRGQYLGGRFLGALAVTLLIYPAIGIGAWLAMQLPVLDGARVGPPIALAYVQPYLIVLLPNLVVTTAIFFSLSTLLRRMFPVYVGSVVLLIGYIIAVNASDGIENKALAALLDPFGLMAVDRVTEYWTVAERNTRLIPLSGYLLYNRLLWGGVALALLALTGWRFSFLHRAQGGPAQAADEPSPRGARPAAASDPTRDFSTPASLRLLAALTRVQLVETVKSVYFLVIVLAGVLVIAANASSVGRIYGTETYPVTYEVLEVVGGTFAIFILAIMTFYAGDLVWRERDAGLAQIHDALPIPRWVVFVSKLGALMAVQVLLLGVIMVSGIALQLLRGYYDLEIGLYIKTLFGVRLIEMWTLCALAMLVHVLVNQKYLAHFVMVLYFVISIALPLLGFEHNLYRFGRGPSWTYSAMNGFGHYVAPLFWFKAYWACLAVALALAAHLFWVRGMETGARARLRLAAERLTRPVAIALAASLAAFAGLGAFIYWNTNILNTYRTRPDREAEQADYERLHRVWHKAPQPRVMGVTAEVDIFPAERRVAIRGRFAIQNRTDAPIGKVAVTLPSRARVERLSFGRGETRTLDDARLGFRVFELAAPLSPGEEGSLEFALSYENPGFENDGSDTQIVHNGTFFNSMYFPSLGYRRDDELKDDNTRRRHGLPPRERMADLDDASELRNNYVSQDGDWITFEATVSTTPDQIAIAPGYLTREWTAGGRRHFHYAMDSKILNFYAFISARYEIVRDRWNDVAIEIYHHAGHTYDLDRMVRSTKASLDYFTASFGPYQHRQFRIIEFPRYDTFAQAFPNTIPYSEAIGFIARVDDSKEDEIDYPFYVTAHEMAHQWWAHQVIGGDVQGSTIMSETLSQYSALMVMKRAYGPAAMKKFLRFELERYLRGRGNEAKKELPLLRVEDQNYIHYAKGSLVMYALQDYLGEETVNGALKRYRDATAYKGPPYTNAREFLKYLREATPPDQQHLLEDMFETITLYELRASDATWSARADGKYEVRFTTHAKKLRATELGAESEIPISDEIDIGVLDEKDKPIFLERRKFDREEMQWTVVVDAVPAKAGIDPLNKLIDRKPDDNVTAAPGR